MVLIGVAECLVGSQRHIARTGVAVLGFFRHAPGDHRVEGLGDARAHRAGLWDRVARMSSDQLAGSARTIGRGAGQAFVQHACQCVDVGAVGHLAVGKPFGRHVFPGAHRGAELGEFLVGGGAGDAEVDQVGEIIAGDQDVGRFDVAVHDPGGVRGVESRGDLGDDGHRARRGQRAKPVEHAVQVGALDEVHLHEHLPIDFAVVVDGHHMGFLQTARGARLAPHPLAKDGVPAELRGHHLDRDRPLFDGVLSLVDLAHPAPAQQPF